MSCCRNDAVRSDHGIITNVNVGIIDQRNIEIEIDIVSEVDMVPCPVRVQRRLDVGSLAYLCKHLLQQFPAAYHFCRARQIVFVLQLQTLCLYGKQAFIGGKIQCPGFHFFIYGHDHSLLF